MTLSKLNARVVHNVRSRILGLSGHDENDVLDQGAAGALEAQQAANQLMALSTKQQMQIQQLMAAQYRAQSEDAARKAQSEAASHAMTSQFLGSNTAYSGGW